MTRETLLYQFKNILKEVPKMCLLGVRGYFDSENRTDIYNDCIFRCLDGDIAEFTASVDPGRYYIDHPLNPQGCARLKCGLWLYTTGEHHTHRALVQADEVKVDRLDKTGKSIKEDNGWIGLNIHSGGPEYLVGRWSAGCQIIKTSEPWKDKWEEFFNPIEEGVKVFNQKQIPYLLVDKLEAIPASV